MRFKSNTAGASRCCVLLPIVPPGWIWTRESQREIQEVKAQYDKDVSIIKTEMEARYRETLTERRRAAAILELELEKERQRVKGYKQALVSQSQQLMEERKQLQQVKSHLAPSLLFITFILHVPFNFLASLFINISLTRSVRPWRKRSNGW